MIRRSTTLGAFLLAAALGSGCDDNNSVPVPTPTPPTPISEVIQGNVTPNSVRIHGLQVNSPGTISATYTDITQLDPDNPDNPTTLGLDIGTLIGSTCQVVVSRTGVGLNQAVTGTATAPGSICVRVYDSSANGLSAAVDYTVAVTHF